MSYLGGARVMSYSLLSKRLGRAGILRPVGVLWAVKN